MTFAWPKKGSRLFKVAKKGEPILATWNGNHAGSGAEAFKEAADAILANAGAETRWRVNPELILPVCYLYRHSIELRLKDIIQLGLALRFFKKNEVEKVLKGHALAPLWTKAKALICDVWRSGDQTPVKAVDSVINEFHNLDRTGQVLRYARDTNGKAHDYKTISQPVSCRNLKETMDEVFNFLDGCYSGIDDAYQAMSQDADY